MEVAGVALWIFFFSLPLSLMSFNMSSPVTLLFSPYFPLPSLCILTNSHLRIYVTIFICDIIEKKKKGRLTQSCPSFFHQLRHYCIHSRIYIIEINKKKKEKKKLLRFVFFFSFYFFFFLFTFIYPVFFPFSTLFFFFFPLSNRGEKSRQKLLFPFSFFSLPLFQSWNVLPRNPEKKKTCETNDFNESKEEKAKRVRTKRT